jgi:C-terminal processing protease CtpA/Prc
MKKVLFILLSVSFFLGSCKKDKIETNTNTNNDSITAVNKVINRWIYNNMDTVYYWNNQLPAKPDFTLSPDLFFNSLLSKEDRFSFIIPNIIDLMNLLHDVEKTFGYEYSLYLISANSNNIVGQITYIQKNSPAYYAGLKRGDFFTAINNSMLTTDNYQTLLSINNSTITITTAILNSNLGTFDNSKVVQLTPVTLAEDPVILDTVYQISNNTIGYLLYKQFAADPGDNSLKYDKELESVFGNFKQAGVNSLVLDLRMNPGGALSSATKLASLIVKGLNTENIFLKNNFNPLMESMLTYYYGNNYFNVNFVSEPNNIGSNLNNFIVLTSRHTASAGEDLINGLKAYMPVYLIGDTTVGKNYGSITIYDETKKISWGLQPLVLKVSNSLGQSDFSKGFAPDVRSLDKGITLQPFGDTSETLLAAAITKITNGTNKSYNVQEPAPGIQFKEIYNSLSRKANIPSAFVDLKKRKKQ